MNTSALLFSFCLIANIASQAMENKKRKRDDLYQPGPSHFTKLVILKEKSKEDLKKYYKKKEEVRENFFDTYDFEDDQKVLNFLKKQNYSYDNIFTEDDQLRDTYSKKFNSVEFQKTCRDIFKLGEKFSNGDVIDQFLDLFQEWDNNNCSKKLKKNESWFNQKAIYYNETLPSHSHAFLQVTNSVDKVISKFE